METMEKGTISLITVVGLKTSSCRRPSVYMKAMSAVLLGFSAFLAGSMFLTALKSPVSLGASDDLEGMLLVGSRNIRVSVPPELINGTVTAPRFSIRIEVRNSPGKLRSDCHDYFFVTISGGAVYSPKITCVMAGTYMADVELVEPGNYSLHLHFGGEVGPDGRSDLCHSVPQNMSFPGEHHNDMREALNFTFRPALPTTGRPSGLVPLKPALGGPTARDASASCPPEQFYEGRFVPTATSYSIGGLRSMTWKPFRTPEQCDWPAFWGEERTLQCLAEKWIAFVGDSTMNEIACNMVIDLYGRFDSRWADPSSPHRPGEKCNRLWDTGFSRPGLPRISSTFIGHADPQGNCQGVASLWDKAVATRLKRMFGKASRPTPADVLVFNTGLHDICSREGNETFATLFDKVEQALGTVARFGKRRVWKTTSPRLQKCNPRYGLFPRVPWMNEHMTPLARRYGFQIADQYYINLAYQAEGDGLHCKQGLACKTFASSLLNFVCTPAWHAPTAIAAH